MSIPKGYDPVTGHMDFSLALQEIKKGRLVRRAAYPNFVIGIDGHNRHFTVYGGEFLEAVYELDADDLLATDWEEA